MYTPSYAQMSERERQWAFIQEHSFGLLCSGVAGELQATHLPFVLQPEDNCLVSHMARANAQWQGLSGQQVLVVFSGPHAYISPTWYDEVGEVPTWNYLAVHVYGILTIIDDPVQVERLLHDLIARHEPTSSLLGHMGEPSYRAMQKAIVAFRIDIQRVEGKAKMNQNKSLVSQQSVAAHLATSQDATARALGAIMAQNIADKS